MCIGLNTHYVDMGTMSKNKEPKGLGLLTPVHMCYLVQIYCQDIYSISISKAETLVGGNEDETTDITSSGQENIPVCCFL
jgi:hypothetical protein